MEYGRSKLMAEQLCFQSNFLVICSMNVLNIPPNPIKLQWNIDSMAFSFAFSI